MDDSSYSSIAAKTAHQSESNVLPPINGIPMQAYNHQQLYNGHSTGSVPGSMPQTPITPHTPLQGGASSAPPEANAFAHAAAGNPPRTLHPPPSYPSVQPGSAAIAGPQHYGHMQPNSILPRLTQPPHLSNIMANSPYVQREQEPTHVVGQQGRRGILPSAAGRPTPNGKMAIPPKNEEGKFPCPHCTKTYLHAKHLKRHMLRHTGDRPYQCKLCKDTFSRSDILKRHFQKCSIRRGHTGDQNHLEGSRNHLKQNQQNRLSTGSLGESPYGHMNGGATSGAAYEPGIANQYMNPVSEFVSQQSDFNNGAQQSLSNRSSRSNSHSLNYPGTIAGMPPNMNAYGQIQQQAPTGYGFNHAVTSADLSGAAHTRTANANGINQQMPWPGSYQGPGGNEFMYAQQPAPAPDRDVKPEPESLGGEGMGSNPALYNTNMYTTTSSSVPSNQVFDGWNLGDPFDVKAAALVAYCFADGLPRTQSELLAMDQLKVILTAANIKRYLQFFRDNWNEHWPTIHMPTFSTLEANNGLLLAMMCVGAIYSDEMGLEMERWLMVLIRRAVERSFECLKVARGQAAEQSGFEDPRATLEEIQTLLLLESTFLWHGTSEHRKQAAEDYRALVTIARKYRLTEPVPYGQKGYSMLHQSHQNQVNIDLTKWDWQAWIQQEERSRLMLQIFLVDCAMAMFFNSPPLLSHDEIQVQLPCDDAAWDAQNAEACMNALGMNGDDAQDLCNVSGSRRLSQPEFHLCMQLLFSPQSEFAPRTTNIFSKFLLIHALHAGIWSLQNQAVATHNLGGFGTGSVPGTPLSQHDWVSASGSYTASNPSSGRATPTEAFPPANPQHVNALRFALEKWKRAYETDIDIQYPPNGSPSTMFGRQAPRRIGFCRDAVHYYWLAKQFLSSPRTFNWQAYSEPDQRMGFVMSVLKQIRTFVAREGCRLGKELGSVAEIREEYAVDMTKLNMRDLFVTLSACKSG